MLPTLTPRQFLLLHLLFAGRQSGSTLRTLLGKLGVQNHPVAFCRDMKQLEALGFVHAEFSSEKTANTQFRRRRYSVTDFGVWEWIKTRKFYENLAPPSPDLIPIPTDDALSAAYDQKTRDELFRTELKKVLRDLLKTLPAPAHERPD